MLHKFKQGLTSVMEILLSHCCAGDAAFFNLSITVRAQIGQALPWN